MRLWVRLTFLSDLHVRLIFGQMSSPIGEALGQVDIFDLWSDVSPRLGFGSGWHFCHLWVRLTVGQIYPQMRLQVRLTFGQTLVRCTPNRDILCPSVVLSSKELWVQIVFWSFAERTPVK